MALALLLTGWCPAAAPPVALLQPSPPPPARPWLPPVWAALEALPDLPSTEATGLILTADRQP